MKPLTLSDNSRVVAAKEQVSCDLAGEAAILNLKDGVYYGLDPVGARIWSLIQTPRTYGEIRGILLDEYEVEASQLEPDILRLFQELAEHRLVDIGVGA